MSHALTALASLLAFALLALAMDRHQLHVFGRELAPKANRLLRLGGWSLLALALFVAVDGQGWARGLVSYSGHTSLSAGLVFVALAALGRRRAER